MSCVSSLTSNLVHPIKYMQERGARQAAQVVQFNTEVKTGITTLTTSEKGILGRIADAIRVLFGMKGAPGSVVDLKYCLNQLKKHVITQGNLALSHSDEPIKAFRQALSTRATLLKLPVSDKMMTAYARQMFKDALGETLDCKAVDALVKTTFTVDKKGYSKKAKVAMGVAAASLVGAAAYYGYRVCVPQISDTCPLEGGSKKYDFYRKRNEGFDDSFTAAGRRKLNAICTELFTQPGVKGNVKCESIIVNHHGGHEEIAMNLNPGQLKVKIDYNHCGSHFDGAGSALCVADLNKEGTDSIKSQLPADNLCTPTGEVNLETQHIKGTKIYGHLFFNSYNMCRSGPGSI